MADEFTNQTILITGASSGIGRATALAFARHGANVAAADVSAQEGHSLLDEIDELEGRGVFIECDVSKAAEVESMVDRTVEAFGGIDFAFNNAGIEGELATTVECTEDNWDRVLGINLKGVWLCMKHEIPVMQQAGHGVIVNCASVAGLVGFRTLPAYSASKGGIVELTRTTALEYADSGIRVNAVCPGVIRTPMVDRVLGGDSDAESQFMALEPVGRFGRPEEIAASVMWLCSKGASFVTGHSLVADGGLVAQ